MLIGLTGPIGAGTDSAAEILKEKGFKWFSYSDVLREEARKRGIEINRKNLQDLGDELRLKEGIGVISKRIIANVVQGENYVMGNIRNGGEIDEFLRFGDDFILIKIDAPVEIRFNRVKERRRESDPIDFDEFKKLEEKDLGIGQAEYGQRHMDVFEMADFIIINDGNMEDLKKKVEMVLERIKC